MSEQEQLERAILRALLKKFRAKIRAADRERWYGKKPPVDQGRRSYGELGSHRHMRGYSAKHKSAGGGCSGRSYGTYGL